MTTSWKELSSQAGGEKAVPKDGALARAPSESSDSQPPDGDDKLALEEVLQTVGETAYRWDLARDRIAWARNAAKVLGVTDLEPLTTGRAFSLHVHAEDAGPRFDMLTGGAHRVPESTIRYRSQYRFLPEGRRGSAMRRLEEIGSCRIGPDGRPAWIEGVIRVLDDGCEDEERLDCRDGHDELTGQLNRTQLTERLAELISSPSPRQEGGAFLLAAVNDLTLINETYGFDTGDQIIAMVGRRLARALRGNDCVGRFSSNKFGILLHRCPENGISTIAKRLMGLVGDHSFATSAGTIAATISIGAVKLPEHANNAQLATGRALQALEAARTTQRDRFMLYQRSERRESERRRAARLADEIVQALNDRRMVLALQPIVRSKTREIAAYECLLRMQNLDGSIHSAGEFVPVAEKYGLSKLIDARVLEMVCELLRQTPQSRFSLNVSEMAAGDGDWLSNLQALTNVDPSLTERLIVEIDETMATAKLDEMTHFIAEVRRLGSQVALDGFGTGYSSFRHLESLGIDLVKIDPSFVENVTSSAQDRNFVRTLVDLAVNLGIATVGEGVGDEATAETLEETGVAYMQGYFFGGPTIAPNAGKGVARIDLA